MAKRLGIGNGQHALAFVDTELIARPLYPCRSSVATGGLVALPALQGTLAELDDFVVASGQPVRVQIQPLNSGIAFWSYVSVTNNESQQITLVTPR